VLVTGGVHGYETSGVQGALLFLQTEAHKYAEHFNVLVCPCVSPWGYECIQRWTKDALDPNRKFFEGSGCEESNAILQYIKSFHTEWLMHIDCHETTDSDATEFIPATDARDGKKDHKGILIPDGFYLIGNSENQSFQEAWHTAMINAVKKVTHIAPPDSDG
jgi:predicted deacylase